MRDKRDNATYELPGFALLHDSVVPAAAKTATRPRVRRAPQVQLALLEETDATGLPVWHNDPLRDLTGLPVWAPSPAPTGNP